MDDQRFDSLVRALTSQQTRRDAVGTLAALMSLRMVGQPPAAAKKNKVQVCHRTGSQKNPVVLIEVDDDAVPAHQAHGDTINPDFENDPNNCGGCGIVCDDDNDLCTTGSCSQGQCFFAIKLCQVGLKCCPSTGQCSQQC